jgi:ABC-2 type transport system permease protein
MRQDLVATAPISTTAMLRAKLEAVVIALSLPLAPAGAGAGIRLALLRGRCFRRSCRRGIELGRDPVSVPRHGAGAPPFSRRQTASRIATFAEAFSSISWAARRRDRPQPDRCWPSLP